MKEVAAVVVAVVFVVSVAGVLIDLITGSGPEGEAGVTDVHANQLVRAYFTEPLVADAKWRGKWVSMEVGLNRRLDYRGRGLPMLYGLVCHLSKRDEARFLAADAGDDNYIVVGRVGEYRMERWGDAVELQLTLEKCRIVETDEEARERRRSTAEAEAKRRAADSAEWEAKLEAERKQGEADEAERARLAAERRAKEEDARKYYRVPGDPETKVPYANVAAYDARHRGGEPLVVGNTYCIPSLGVWDAKHWLDVSQDATKEVQGYPHVLGCQPYSLGCYLFLDEISYRKFLEEMARYALAMGEQYARRKVFILARYTRQGAKHPEYLFFVEPRIAEVREEK